MNCAVCVLGIKYVCPNHILLCLSVADIDSGAHRIFGMYKIAAHND